MRKRSSIGNGFVSPVYAGAPVRVPIDRRTATALGKDKGLPRGEDRHFAKNEKPPVLINTDRLPDNSNEQRKWELRQARQGMLQKNGEKKQKYQGAFRLDALKKLVVLSCVDARGISIAYVVGGFFDSIVSVFPLRYVHEFSRRGDCWPFLEEFTIRRRAECAAVLLARRLGVRVARGIEESISESDLVFYYPVESREGGAQ